ncbi:MAG: hypothetical protein J7L07_10160 [Candidatus Odinarchaeota archaeon]|nr:hypothetical protein [Candidatus Odinarchaeota archaeon]
MGSLTKYYRLYKPDINERNWGEEVNRNFDIIDTFLKYLEKEIYNLYLFHNRIINRLEIEITEAEKEFNTLEDILKSMYDISLQSINKLSEKISDDLDINLQNINKISENLTSEVSYEFIS